MWNLRQRRPSMLLYPALGTPPRTPSFLLAFMERSGPPQVMLALLHTSWKVWWIAPFPVFAYLEGEGNIFLITISVAQGIFCMRSVVVVLSPCPKCVPRAVMEHRREAFISLSQARKNAEISSHSVALCGMLFWMSCMLNDGSSPINDDAFESLYPDQ